MSAQRIPDGARGDPGWGARFRGLGFRGYIVGLYRDYRDYRVYIGARFRGLGLRDFGI